MDRLVFSDSFLFKTTERIIPGAVSLQVLSEHYARYLFAANYCFGKRVLNAGCGSGYGSEILIQKAREVYNIDISELLIAYGTIKYAKYNNHFMVMDAEKLKFEDKYFDCIIAFELLEHLADPKRFLSECYRVLKDNGRLVLSTPNKVITSPQSRKPYNPYHVNEWDMRKLKKLIQRYFRIESLYGQKLMKPIVLNLWEEFYLKLIQFLVQYTPGLIFRIMKQYVLRYRELSFEEIMIEKNDRITKIQGSDLSLEKNNQAYGIMILVLKKP